MRPYLATLSARFRMLLQYRSAALAGIVTQVFFGFVRVMIFRAFYASSDAPHPLSLHETTSYIWLGQAFLLVAMLGVDAEVAALIRSGNVAYDLARPVDLHSFWLARALAGRAAPTCLRVVPILALAAIVGDLQGPSSAGGLALALLSQALGLVLATAMYTVVTISLMWTVSGEGASRLAPAVVWFFSGIILPLPLFPAWAQPLLGLLPFRGIVDVPFRIYLGHLAGSEALLAVLQQAAWIAAFVVLGRVLLARGVARLVVQGG